MPLMRGAFKTPRHKLLAAEPHRAFRAPPQFAVVPKQLSMWGNNQYGDCVSAEEAFAKAVWSVYCGLPETFVAEGDVIAWAGKHGFLDGADLVEVMQAMARDGMPAAGHVYTDGGYQGVDYSNEAVVQSAISTGPVKIAIDANALPSGAGNQSGWYAVTGGHFPNTDHCVGLCGYGSAGWLYQQLGVPLPAGLPANTQGYLLFTWNTIGFVTHAWLMGTCTEAWVRNPTTPGQSPVPPVPPVPPIPPVPPVPPEPPVNPNYTVTVSGSIPTGMWGHMTPVTLTGTATPQAGLAAAAPGALWLQILALLAKYGSILVPIVLADIQAGKSVKQILADCLAALGL